MAKRENVPKIWDKGGHSKVPQYLKELVIV